MAPRRGSRWAPAAVLAWSLWGVWLVLVVCVTGVVLSGRGTSEQGFAVLSAGYATVGALVAARRPGNAIGWLLLVVALALAIANLGDLYVITADGPHRVTVAWLTTLLSNVWLFLPVSFLPLLFPDSRLLSRRWRPVLWCGLSALVAITAASALRPGRMDVEDDLPNPVGTTGALGRTVLLVEHLASATLLVVAMAGVGSLVLRFRRAHGRERRQLQWFAFAGLLTLGSLLLAALGFVLPAPLAGPVGSVGWISFVFSSVLAIPVATGIAILRHRLYDIDVVINRTLVYTTLTATLVSVYVCSVLLLRLVLSPFVGQSPLAIAASTLAVAALFRPARHRIQSLVDRRFYRRKYDAARTLRDFAAQLRHELDLDAVAADLRTAVNSTLQPTHLSLWLRDRER